MQTQIFIHYLKLDELLSINSTTAIKALTKVEKQLIQQQRNLYLSHFLKSDLPLNITEDEYGKPYAVDHPNLSFNQSHSQAYYSLAYTNTATSIGIDIEDFSRKINMDALAKRYFHAEEIKKWEASGKDKMFWLKVWTTKEAVLKAHGLGIRLSLKTINTNIDDKRDFSLIHHEQLGTFRYHCFQMDSSILTIAYKDIGANAKIIFK